MKRVAGLLFLTALGGCLIERLPQQRPAPTIRVTVVEELGKGGARDCATAGAMEMLHGGVPADARAVVKLRAVASETMPLGALQDAIAAKAAPRCVHGLSVLRAVADDGARGVVEAVAVAWFRRAPDEAMDQEEAPAPMSDDDDAP